jgi:hypothetical protein
VAPHTLSSESVFGESGGMIVLKGCVAAARSPGAVLVGTGRSSTGKIGSPDRRFSTKSCPVFVAWSAAGTSRPPRLSETSAGGEALS